MSAVIEHHVPNARKRVFVVVDGGVNSRIRSLGDLRGPGVDFVYVSRRPVKVEPDRNIVVEPLPNPIGVLRKIGLDGLKNLLDSVIYFPTRDKLYVTPVTNRLRTLVGDALADGIDVVLVTCAPPHALSLIGQKLKQEYPAIRWVMDWQDLWTFDEGYLNRVFPLYRGRVRRLEQAMVREADVNVTTNEHARRALADITRATNVVAISHHYGHGPTNVEPIAPEARGEDPERPLRLVFMGGMFKGAKVPGGKFLTALAQARARGAPLELHLYGRQSDEFERYRHKAAAYGLTYHGVVPRDQVPLELRRYDYQLLLLDDLPNSKLIMHLKLPEYLAAGLPILAVVPSGSAVHDILRNTGTGIVVPSDSDWVDGLLTLANAGDGQTKRNQKEIARYSWEHVKEDWSRALAL